MTFWITKSGKAIALSELSDQHLTNILQQLQRAAESKRLAVVEVYDGMSAMSGDVKAHFTRMYDRVMEQSWRDYVDAGFVELEAEAVRRCLLWDVYDNRPVMVDLSRYGQLESLLVGALRDSINQHGNVTPQNAPSAAKRLMGALKTWNNRRKQC